MLELLLRRWPLKLLALALAFAIWVAVTGENKVVQDFRVPLEVTLRKDAILEREPPTTVTVRLRGPENVLQRMAPFDLEMRVDLRDADVGERNVSMTESALVGVPPGVETVLIDPARLTLQIARRARKSVPVAPAFVGKPGKGFAFYWAEAVPDNAEVEGPDAKLAQVSRLRTDPIHLEGRTGPFTVRVGAVPDNPEVRVVDPKPIEVRAHIDVAPVEAAYDAVPVLIAGRGAAAEVNPSTIRVTLAGPPALLGKIRSSQLRATADVTGLPVSPLPHLVPLRIDFVDVPLEDLARITVRSLSRSKVEVRISDRRHS